ncbi:NAD(P)H-dependent oxidoreductase [soil metagenome]
MPKLHTIVVSTRPGRQGPAVANWFHALAQKHGKFAAELIDLAEVNLPLFDEPVHPRLRQYANDHTKRWSASVESADAFVFVTPEYNYSAPPSLVNALDYLVQEWAYKPAGFVSYGGVSGGTRSVQMTKGIVTTLKMMPMVESVAVPFFNQFINDEGIFDPGEVNEKAGAAMLDEMLRWTEAMKGLRA